MAAQDAEELELELSALEYTFERLALDKPGEESFGAAGDGRGTGPGAGVCGDEASTGLCGGGKAAPWAPSPEDAAALGACDAWDAAGGPASRPVPFPPDARCAAPVARAAIPLAPRSASALGRWISGWLEVSVPRAYPSVPAGVRFVGLRGAPEAAVRSALARLRAEAAELVGAPQLGALLALGQELGEELDRPSGTCPICLEPLEADAAPDAPSRPVPLPCCHGFHAACILAAWRAQAQGADGRRDAPGREGRPAPHSNPMGGAEDGRGGGAGNGGGASAASDARSPPHSPRPRRPPAAAAPPTLRCPVCRAELDPGAARLTVKLAREAEAGGAAARGAGAEALASATCGAQAARRASTSPSSTLAPASLASPSPSSSPPPDALPSAASPPRASPPAASSAQDDAPFGLSATQYASLRAQQQAVRAGLEKQRARGGVVDASHGKSLADLARAREPARAERADGDSQSRDEREARAPPGARPRRGPPPGLLPAGSVPLAAPAGARAAAAPPPGRGVRQAPAAVAQPREPRGGRGGGPRGGRGKEGGGEARRGSGRRGRGARGE